MAFNGGRWHLAQADSICHAHNDELGSNDVLHACTIQLAHDCATGIGKDGLYSVFPVSQDPVLQHTSRLKIS